MIFRAYIDDSDISGPIAVLGGWIAPAWVWADFANAWQEALRMRPILDYFKMREAMSLSGQFGGWTEEARDQRIKYLANLIQEHKLIAVGSVVPLGLYREIFYGKTDKKFDMPYFLMFHGLMSGILKEFNKVRTDLERVDFVFDEQPGQMEVIPSEWVKFKRTAPPELKKLLGDPPIFRDDERTLPLQAADMWAWYLRLWAGAEIAGNQPPNAPWAPAGGVMDTVTWIWNRESLQRAYSALVKSNQMNADLGIWPES